MRIHVDEEVCKGCGLCITKCPKNVFALKDKVNSKGFNVVEVVDERQCVACKLCERTCPDLALYIEA